MKTKIIWLSLLATTFLLAWSSAAPVSNGSGKNFFPQIVSDGDGGAIISWLKKTNGCYEVHAQRVTTVSGEWHLDWNNEDPVPISTIQDADIGHRLNHHVIPSTSNSAIYFWANHFDIKSPNPEYLRGYYLQKTDEDGNLKWPIPPADPNPVQVKTTYPVPQSTLAEDGDPISICPDGSGGCVVAMKAAWANPWKIVVNRYDSGGTQHSGWPSGGLVVHEAATEQRFINGEWKTVVHELVGCPKVVQWNDGQDDKYMVIYVTATHAATNEQAYNSEAKLHLCEIDADDGDATDHTVRFPSSGYIPSTYWFYWIPYFDIALNDDNSTIYVAYQLRMKKKWVGDGAPSSYFLDSLFILTYSGGTPDAGTGIDGWKAAPWGNPDYDGPEGNLHNNRPNIDELPLRAPSITYLNATNGVVVVYPRAIEAHWPTQDRYYQENAYLTRQFELKAYKVKDGAPTHLWTLGDDEETHASFHTPHVISDGDGGYVVAYSEHNTYDYRMGGIMPASAAEVYIGHAESEDLDDLSTEEIEEKFGIELFTSAYSIGSK